MSRGSRRSKGVTAGLMLGAALAVCCGTLQLSRLALASSGATTGPGNVAEQVRQQSLVWLAPPLGSNPRLDGARDLINSEWEPRNDMDLDEIVLLVLERHSKSRNNEVNAFQGAVLPGSEVTAKGLEAARAAAVAEAARALHDLVGGIYSSPARRSVQTARPLVDRFGVGKLRILSELLEVRLPQAWIDCNKDEIKRSSADYRGWLHNPYRHTPAGGESAEEVLARMEGSLCTMEDAVRALDKRVAYAVTHKGPLRYLMGRYLGALNLAQAERAERRKTGTHPHWAIHPANNLMLPIPLYHHRVVLPDRGDGKGPSFDYSANARWPIRAHGGLRPVVR